MKICFRFENGTSELYLLPENQRDKTMLTLFTDSGTNNFSIKATKDETLCLVSRKDGVKIEVVDLSGVPIE